MKQTNIKRIEYATYEYLDINEYRKHYEQMKKEGWSDSGENSGFNLNCPNIPIFQEYCKAID